MMDYTKMVKALRCGQIVAATENDCKNCPYFIGGVCAWTICMSDAAAAIEELKAQLPKRGEWELIDGAEPMRWGCSRCKYLSWDTSNYCPRCGAKMEVQDGKDQHGDADFMRRM